MFPSWRKMARVEPPRPRRLELSWLAAALFSAAALGALSHWVLFEYDLYWQVHAGSEILAGQGVQSVERWSHTAYGTPWHNIQWLSTVLLALVSRISPGYVALTDLRSLLVALWISLLCLFLREGKQAWLTTLALAPFVYLACWYRLQMRPDLFGLCCFAGLLALLCAERAWRWRRAAGLALLLLWANLHAGTVVFGILLYGADCLLGVEAPRPAIRARALWASAGLLAWFATPGGVAILAIVRDNALLYDWSKSKNPDLQPFSWGLLTFAQGGWAPRLWLLYSALAALSLRQPGGRLPRLYRSRWLAPAVAAALTLESLHHIRATPYQMMFLLPLVAARVSSLPDEVRISAAAAAALFLWGYALPYNARYVAHPLGRSVSRLDFPIESARFVEQTRPAGKLHNGYAFGGYLVDQLPGYPVSIDGRELPFLRFRGALDQAAASGQLGSFLRGAGVNTVIAEPSQEREQPGVGTIDSRDIDYPRAEWALVFLDNVSVVYLRRAPENAGIIAAHEYRMLRRGLPAGWGAQPGLPEPLRRELREETGRCLRETPENVYCLQSRAAFLGADGKPDEARAALEQARAIDPKNLATLVALLQDANARGDREEADGLIRTLDRVGARAGP